MRKLQYLLMTLIFLTAVKTYGQSLPVGNVALEDYYRRLQLSGKLDSSISFTVRPLIPDSTFVSKYLFRASPREGRKFKAFLLPFSLQGKMDTHHPTGWNDGAMIPAKGLQTLVSAGFYASYGPLSIQLRPEFVFASNDAFDTFNEDHYEVIDARYYDFYNYIDLPARFGQAKYNQVYWGQSSIRLNYKSISLGLSSENLWWGPGMRNSLLMSNTAPGFKHLTLNTRKPVSTALGSFEGQLLAGRLEGSGFGVLEPEKTYFEEDLYLPKRNNWRYLAGLVVTWQPKWVPSLFLGLARSSQLYAEDLSKFGDYLPFGAKGNHGTADHPIDKKDQRNTYFMRWLWPAEKAEIYFEYGRDNYSGDYQDLMLTPNDSRAYVFGVRKLFPFGKRGDQNLMLHVEVAQLAETSLDKVAAAESWYINRGVRHGYTHRGEVLGAGIGPGANSQSFEISWVNGLKRLGLQFERYVHNNDFYYYAYEDSKDWRRHWTDLSIAAVGEWNFKNLILNARFQGTNALNYQWFLFQEPEDPYTIPGKDAFNLQIQAGLTYRF